MPETRKIRVFRGKPQDRNRFYFHVLGDNGEKISQSEGYMRRDDLLDTVEEYYPGWKIVDEKDHPIIRG